MKFLLVEVGITKQYLLREVECENLKRCDLCLIYSGKTRIVPYVVI